MRGNLIRLDFGDVAGEYMLVAVVCLVGRLAEAVPLGREDALPTDRLESLTETANAGEQIDEGEIGTV